MIELQYFTKSDFQQLKDWINTPELMYNWAGSLFSFPLTDAALDWYIEDVNEVGSSEAFIFKAVHKETQRVVGHISLGSISEKNRSGRITRVFLDTSTRGNGYCRQMVRALIDFGFEQLNLHRISLGVYTNNASAIKCYGQAGMVAEGVQRDVFLHNDEFWSLQEMSILQPEWAVLKVQKDNPCKNC